MWDGDGRKRAFAIDNTVFVYYIDEGRFRSRELPDTRTARDEFFAVIDDWYPMNERG